MRARMIRFGTIDGIVLPFRHGRESIDVQWQPSGYGGRSGSIDFSDGISKDQEERAKFLIAYLAERWKPTYLKQERRFSELLEKELVGVSFSESLVKRVREGDFYRFHRDWKVSPAALGFGSNRTPYEPPRNGFDPRKVLPERYR